MDDRVLAIWLSEALSYGSIYAKRLIEKYGSLEEIYRLNEAGYESVGIKRGTQEMAKLLSKELDAQKKILSFCDYNYFEVIGYTSNMYPQRLRAIKNPPAAIYTRGRMLDFDDNVCIAVVGTRSYSDIGWNSTYKITAGLASGGAVIVTGLASGIDTAATRAALDTAGFAVGVLGSGVERIFPSENKELFEEMYKKGLVVSEKPPFSEITGRYFPVRNRLISGLCNGVLIGEGSLKSGAMHTAAHASEQGRRIFAIPGDISNEESSGVNKLVHDGAMPVFDAKDILDLYMYSYPHRIGLSPSASAGNVQVPEARSAKRVRVIRNRSSAVPEEPGVAREAVKKPVKEAVKKPVKKSVDQSEEVGFGLNREGLTKIIKSYERHIKKHGGTMSTGPFPENEKRAAEHMNENKNGLVFEKVFEANMDKLESRIAAHEAEDCKAMQQKQSGNEAREDVIGKLEDIEKKVYLCVSERGSVAADTICMAINEDPMNVNIALTSLEMYGLIVTEGPNIRKKQ